LTFSVSSDLCHRVESDATSMLNLVCRREVGLDLFSVAFDLPDVLDQVLRVDLVVGVLFLSLAFFAANWGLEGWRLLDLFVESLQLLSHFVSVDSACLLERLAS